MDHLRDFSEEELRKMRDEGLHFKDNELIGQPKISQPRTLERIQLNYLPLSSEDKEILSTMVGNYSQIEGHALMNDIPVSQGKLKKLQLRAGTGRPVVEGELVKVKYIFGAENMDDIISSSYENLKPFRFHVGKGEVLPLLDFGVTTMKVGEEAKFLGTSEFGFGKLGVPLGFSAVVPPAARVIMQIELLDALAPKPVHPGSEISVQERRQLSFEVLIKHAEELKLHGNFEFKDKDYDQARSTYKTVIKCLEEISTKTMTADERKRYLTLSIVVNNNLANTTFKMGKFKKTIKYSMQAIVVPIYSVQKAKSYYWHAKALFEKGDFKESHEQAQTGYSLCVGDKDFKILLRLAEKKVAEQNLTEKLMCKRIFEVSLK